MGVVRRTDRTLGYYAYHVFYFHTIFMKIFIIEFYIEEYSFTLMALSFSVAILLSYGMVTAIDKQVNKVRGQIRSVKALGNNQDVVI